MQNKYFMGPECGWVKQIKRSDKVVFYHFLREITVIQRQCSYHVETIQFVNQN